MATSERNGILLVALWKSNYPLLLSQTVINHIFLESWIDFQ